MEKHEASGTGRGDAHREAARGLLALQRGTAEIVQSVALGRRRQLLHDFFADLLHGCLPPVSAICLHLECPAKVCLRPSMVKWFPQISSEKQRHFLQTRK